MASNIPVIVQGNSFSLAIPLQIYYINGDQMDLQDYTPDPTDEVSVQLKGSRRNYTYTPTIDGNIANIGLTGNELAGNYSVVVSVVKADGQRLRSFRTDQFFIVESSDDLTQADIIAGLEENVIYLNSSIFVAGADGRGIVSIVKTSTSGLVDTYTITYTDNTTSTFNVTNGAQGEAGSSIASIAKTGTSGLVDTYTITLTDGSTTTFEVTNGMNGVDLGLANIVNDLTTGGATNVLSAEMGKELGYMRRDITQWADSPNLFDPTAVTNNKCVNKNNGTLLNDSSWVASDYIAIPVETSSMYTTNESLGGSVGWACYNSSKVFTHGGVTRMIEFTSGDAYVRVSVQKSHVNTCMIVVGESSADLPSEYKGFGTTYSLHNDVVKTASIKDSEVTESKLSRDANYKLNKAVGYNIADTNTYASATTKTYNFGNKLLIKDGQIYYVTLTATNNINRFGIFTGDAWASGTNKHDNLVPNVRYKFTASGDITYLKGYLISGTPCDVTIRVETEHYIEQINQLLEDEILIDYTKDGNSLFTDGGYINMSGIWASSSSYSYTDYLAIPIKKNISLIDCQTYNTYMACIAFYDKNKAFISALQKLTPGTQVGSTVITPEQIPNDAYYIRVSGAHTTASGYRSRIEYQVQIKEFVLQTQSEVNSLDGRVSVLEIATENVKPIVFSSFSGSDTLTPNGLLFLLANKVRVNSILTAVINGAITQVDLGVGYSSLSPYRTYDARWIELTQTQVKVYAYYNTTPFTLQATYSHGLTLTNKTFVSFITGVSSTESEPTTTIRIATDKGDIWTQELGSWGQGIAFIQNKNTTGDLAVELNFLPRDITKNVWAFGDSYFGHWVKYLYGMGINSWLRDSQPGLAPITGCSNFENLLSLGYRPAYAFYCLGMNGDTSETKVDGEYVINSYQKQYIDAFKALCDQYNIIPVFMTIPTVPTRQKTGFRSYIQSLGVRYVDAYAAVGADEYGIWHGSPTLRAWKNGTSYIYTQIYDASHAFIEVGNNTFDVNGDFTGYTVTAVGDSNSSITVNGIVYDRSSADDIIGLLSTDGVHPTAIGAKVIAYAVIAEFPEIGVSE